MSLGRFGLADATGQAGLDDPATFVVDLAQGDPVVAEFRGLEAKRWPGLAFSFAPPKDGDRRIGDVSEEDFVALRARGLTHLRGVAEGRLQVRIASISRPDAQYRLHERRRRHRGRRRAPARRRPRSRT